MEFLKHLKNEWDSPVYKEAYLKLGIPETEIPQRSEGIEFKNGLILSIQGSFAHYCFPRKTLPYDKYTDMEFALCTTEGFKEVKDYINTDEYDKYFEGSVYGYVPVPKIEKLYLALKEKFSLKEEPFTKESYTEARREFVKLFKGEYGE